MSLAHPISSVSALRSYTPPTASRKRTTSFCCSSTGFTPNTRPTKAPRTDMGSLRRTESFLCLSDMQKKSSPSVATAPIERSRRRTTAKTSTSTSTPAPSPSPTSVSQLQPQRSVSKQASFDCTYRSSSPLSPHRTALPGRPVFPRSKHEPDLYRQAIIARMRCSPEGQRILHMGPKLAISIMSATKELEMIVAAQETDNDVPMSDASVSPPILSASWIVVPGESSQDWEMVDCGA